MANVMRDHPYYSGAGAAGTLGAGALAFRHRDAIRGSSGYGKASNLFSKVKSYTYDPVRKGIYNITGYQRRRRSRRGSKRSGRRRRRSRRSRR
jgi:hypothetical protein